MDKKKILIVEDERIIAEDLRQTLNRLGYEVTGIASDSREALEKAAANIPDLAIMDIILSGKTDGITVAERLKARFDIPSIYLTAYADENILKRARISAPYSYIMKPFEEKELHTNVEIAIERSMSERLLKRTNIVLKTVRNINQLIVREQDRRKLLWQACKILTGDRGYPRAWIILLDKDGKLLDSAQSGWEKQYQDLPQMFTNGSLPECGQLAMNNKGNAIRKNSSHCQNCPFHESYPHYYSLTIALISHGLTYGLMSVALPERTPVDENESDLFKELAGDIAVAIHNIEMENRRRQLEKELQISEEKYHGLFEQSPVGFALHQDGKLILLNPVAVKMLGYDSSDEMIGKPLIEFVHPSSRESVYKRIKILLSESGNVVKQVEEKFIRKDGSSLDVSVIGQSINYEGSLAIQVFFLDITERKQADEKLVSNLEQTRKLRDTVEQLNRVDSLEDACSVAIRSITVVIKADRAAILLEDPDNIVRFKAWDGLSDEYRKATEGHFPWELSDLDAKPITIENIAEADLSEELRTTILNEGINACTFIPLVGKDQLLGKFMTYYNQVHIFKSDEMNVARVLADNLSTVIERLRNQEALSDSRERYRSTVESLKDLIFTIDKNGHFIDYYTPGQDTLLYTPPEKFLKKKYKDILPPEVTAILTQSIEKLKSGETSTEFTYPMDIKGKTLWFDATITARHDSQGKFAGVTVIIRDITDRKQMEEVRRQMQENLDNLFHYTVDAIIIQSRDREILDCNAATEKLFGYSKEELIANPSIRLGDIEKIDNKQREIYINNAMKGRPQRFEWWGKRKDGSSFPEEIILNRTFYNGKEVLFITIRDITKRKQAEEELRKLSRSVEQSPSSVIITDRDGIIEYVNPKFEEISGYSSSEILGQNSRTLKTGIHSDDFYSKLWQTISSGKEWHGEFCSRKKSGDIYWEIASVSPVLDRDGSITHFVTVKEDISERKQIEMELQESEQKYKHIFNLFRSISDDMTDMLWAKDMDKRYIFVNRAICKNLLNAIDTDEPVGKTDMFFAERERNRYPENEKWHTFGEICRDSDQAIIDSKKSGRFEEYGNVKGKFLYLVVHKSPLFNDNGEMVGIVGSARDVTREKEIQKNLEESEKRLKTIIDTEPECVKLLAPDGALLDMNQAGLNMIEADSLDQVKGQPILSIISPDYHQAYQKMFDQVMIGHTELLVFKIIGLKGTERWMEAHSAPLYDPDNNVIGLLGVTRDITERMQTEKELNRKMRDLEQANKFMINRELKMVELKREVNELLLKLGQLKKYRAPDERE